jgi:uncharacterized membrane protein YhaH (DUF805 family)
LIVFQIWENLWRKSRSYIAVIAGFFPDKCIMTRRWREKMNRYFWLLDHPAALWALVAGTILAFAWPLQDVPACVVAALMMVVAAGITIRAHFHSARYGQ